MPIHRDSVDGARAAQSAIRALIGQLGSFHNDLARGPRPSFSRGF
jgi:hypothetical protein